MTDWWYELFLTICEDMQEPASYIPWGAKAGLLAVILAGIYEKSAGGRIHLRRLAGWFGLAFYGVITANTVFFSRAPGSREGVDLRLLGTWGTTVQSQGYVVENVLLFIPFGILLPLCFRRMKSGIWCILAGCICSTAIELIQLKTGRGYCQLDDVVMNTAGTAMGWCLYRTVSAAAGLVRGDSSSDP